MTLDEALADAAAQIDAILAKGLDDLEGLLIEHGATDAELAAEMAIAERTRAAELARLLGIMRGMMLRDGKALQ